MSRFYVPKENITGERIIIEGEEAHHIIDVMRLGEGDDVVVFDGEGTEYAGKIVQVASNRKSLQVLTIETRDSSSDLSVKITIAQSIPKKEKMDYIMQKATELGVHSIIPIITDRTIVRPRDKSSSKKVSRWSKITLEAAKQCGRSDVPLIDEIIKFSALKDIFDNYELVLFACLSDDTVSLKEAIPKSPPENILIVIGPEGGFSPKEISSARSKGVKMVSFGKRVLKSDTAGLFALSVLGYEYSI